MSTRLGTIAKPQRTTKPATTIKRPITRTPRRVTCTMPRITHRKLPSCTWSTTGTRRKQRASSCRVVGRVRKRWSSGVASSRSRAGADSGRKSKCRRLGTGACGKTSLFPALVRSSLGRPRYARCAGLISGSDRRPRVSLHVSEFGFLPIQLRMLLQVLRRNEIHAAGVSGRRHELHFRGHR